MNVASPWRGHVERARSYTHGEGTFIHHAPCANTCMATNMFGRPVLQFIPAFVCTHVHTSCTYSAFVRWCHHLLFFSRPCSGIPSSQGPRPWILCLASLAHTFCNVGTIRAYTPSANVGIMNEKCVHECAAQDIHTHTHMNI